MSKDLKSKDLKTLLKLKAVAPLFKTYDFVGRNQAITVLKFALIKDKIYVGIKDITSLFLGKAEMVTDFAKIMIRDGYEVKRLDTLGSCEKHNECTATKNQPAWDTLIATTSDTCCFLETFNPKPSELINAILLAAKLGLACS